MAFYRLARQEFHFVIPVSSLEPYEVVQTELVVVEPLPVQSEPTFSCLTTGWVGQEWRAVEIWTVPPGILLKVAGGSDFYISPDGMDIVHAGDDNSHPLSDLDRDILLGPALVLALALRGTWSLHASAALCRETTIAFLGESGRGKSTLAAYLSSTENPDWRLVADDILPVTISSTGVDVWPRFPQLKLPMQAQPGPGLSEHLPLNALCVLTPAGQEEIPKLQLLSPNLAARKLISHTAGTRMFTPELLWKHLAFCTQVAGQVPVYRLTYPHRRDTLPKIKTLLENIC